MQFTGPPPVPSEVVTCNCVRNPGGHAESNPRPSEVGVSFYHVLRPLDRRGPVAWGNAKRRWPLVETQLLPPLLEQALHLPIAMCLNASPHGAHDADCASSRAGVTHVPCGSAVWRGTAGAGRASGAGGARHEDERPTQLHPGPMHTAHINSPAFRVSR